MVTRFAQLWEAGWPAALALLLACLGFLAWAVLLSVIDVRTHTLPDRYVLPAYPVGVALLAAAAVPAGRPELLGRALLGLLLTLALFAVLWRSYPAGMGLGDVKLSGVLGLLLGFVGWHHVVLGVAAGFVLGGLWGVLLIVTRRGTATSYLPFGPPLLAGALLVLVLPAAP